MSEVPHVLILGTDPSSLETLSDLLRRQCSLQTATTLEQALQRISNPGLAAVCVTGSQEMLAQAIVIPLAGELLSRIPDGMALLDQTLKILWCNSRFRELSLAAGCKAPGTQVGQTFYDAFGTPEILGPDLSPFHTALGSDSTARSQLGVGEKAFYQIEVTPLPAEEEGPRHLIVSVRDVSLEVQQQHKLQAIYQAGLELGELTAADLLLMSVHDRVELLKSKIIHFTQELLEYETVEIRLLDRTTQRLEPLLAVGMEQEACDRELYARSSGHGVTGFVAATGKSYLCEDTTHDPLYLTGARNARSSLTVPLILQEQVLGTFNVESAKTNAFTESDLQFLELFSREVAVALNTLELLVAEKITAAHEGTERLLREVASPVDEVLNDAAWVLERYIGHDPNVAQRLQRILKHTRNIKQLIHKVGEAMTPKVPNSPLPPRPLRPKLRDKRILVADADEVVRSTAHELLGKHGCEVETAHNGEEALLMVRSFQYDAVLADIRLPDMTGYECFAAIKDAEPELPVILMTGFGYDPSHSIVKARERGLKSVLYKPFRVHQLLDELEKTVATTADAVTDTGMA